MKSDNRVGNGKHEARLEPLLSGAADVATESERQTFGGGALFWQKSWECANPEHPYSALAIGPAYLLDALYSLVSRKKNWELAAGTAYLVAACHGKIKERSIRSHLNVLLERGFIEHVGQKFCAKTQKYVKVYLVNPELMGGKKKREYRNFYAASKLVAKNGPIARRTREENLQMILDEVAKIPPEKRTDREKDLLRRHRRDEPSSHHEHVPR